MIQLPYRDIDTGGSGGTIKRPRKVRSYKVEYEKMEKEANAWKKGFIMMTWTAIGLLAVMIFGDVEKAAKIAETIAKRYIEKAFDDCWKIRSITVSGKIPDFKSDEFKGKWLIENGVLDNEIRTDRKCECFPGSNCDSMGECGKKENGVETPKTESNPVIIGSNGLTNPPYGTEEL